MAASSPPIDAELMLYAEQVGIVEVQEICHPPVGAQILLRDLKAHARWVGVAFRAVIDCPDKAIPTWDNRRD